MRIFVLFPKNEYLLTIYLFHLAYWIIFYEKHALFLVIK